MKDFADINILLDRSGSMQSIATDTVGGLNAFIAEQKKGGDNAAITLVQFDSQNAYEIVMQDVHVKDVRLLTEADFKPRGGTPLYDALGMLINQTGQRLAALPEDDRPDQVIVVILTDGYENASTEFNKDKIKIMVEEQQDKYNWKFVFIGADMDAMDVGASIGMNRDYLINVASHNVAETYSTTAALVSNYRVTKDAKTLAYSARDRATLGN